MLIMHNQVCTIEQALKLQELGVQQEMKSFTWLCYNLFEVATKKLLIDAVSYNQYRFRNYQVNVSAFTSTELGLMLPEKSFSYREGERWFCKTPSTPTLEGYYSTETEAKAAKLIQLIDLGLLSVTEINNRLGAVAAV